MGKNTTLLEAMRDLVNHPLARADPLTWLVPLRNRNMSSMSVILRSVLRHAKPAKRAKLAERCAGIMRRMFHKALAGVVLAAGKRDPPALVPIDRAIEADLFDASVTGIPLFNSARIAALTSSVAVRTAFGPDAHKSILAELARVAKALGMATVDELVTPAALTFALMELKRRITSVGVSACNTKPEELLTALVTSDANQAFVDAFFAGAVAATVTPASALADVQRIAPYAGVFTTLGTPHEAAPRFCAAHMFSPAVSVCGICGEQFATDQELADICKSPADRAAVARVATEVRRRRAAHFAQVYHTEPDSNYPTRTSAITSTHRAARVVAERPEFATELRPTRAMVLAVIDFLRTLPEARRGCIFDAVLVRDIVLILWDFVQHRGALKAIRPIPETLSVDDRLVLEATAGPARPGCDLCTMDGLTPEEIATLTAPTGILL
jgi:hypothetical protein